MLRIIAGEFRGRKIKEPGLDTVRPTKDRIRQAVFNVIAAFVPGASVIDIFAGSGAYGLEALSRGAEKAIFLEKNPVCSRVIKENIDVLGVSSRSELVTADAFEWVREMEEKPRFDIVFADPPYNMGMARNILIHINRYDILNHSGLLVIEHHGEEALPDSEGVFTLLKRKTYADISVSFYRRND
jgi:16S rRNA (guanine(966)-N(2))-methyltransferase RsmD